MGNKVVCSKVQHTLTEWVWKLRRAWGRLFRGGVSWFVLKDRTSLPRWAGGWENSPEHDIKEKHDLCEKHVIVL